MSSQVLSLTQAFCNRIVVRLSQQPHFTPIGRSWDVLLEATSTSICSPARNQNRCPQISAIGVADSKHSRPYAHDADIGVAVVRVWKTFECILYRLHMASLVFLLYFYFLFYWRWGKRSDTKQGRERDLVLQRACFSKISALCDL